MFACGKFTAITLLYVIIGCLPRKTKRSSLTTQLLSKTIRWWVETKCIKVVIERALPIEVSNIDEREILE